MDNESKYDSSLVPSPSYAKGERFSLFALGGGGAEHETSMTIIVAVYLPDSPLHIRSVYSMPIVAVYIAAGDSESKSVNLQ